MSTPSKLVRRIHRACRPLLSEPDLATNLEVCDMVNEKAGNAPHEAAATVVRLINSQDPQVVELALVLLDNLVKNCGYPFHLQISRKQFLNELVKRFPERHPARYTRPQRKILAYIEEWYQTLCKHSKYKADMSYIRDMRRLLSYKGYVFPEVRGEDLAVLRPNDNLKLSADIQDEEKVVHAAKLHELIRSGKPEDLKEANRLMKIMAGFKDDEVKASQKSQIKEDLVRVRRKAEVFKEMLAPSANTGKLEESETLSDLYALLKVAQPKLAAIISEEQDEGGDDISDLLQLNDEVHSLLSQYQVLKFGKAETSAPTKSVNLLDFDDDVAAAPSPAPVLLLLDDLGSLNFGSASAPAASAAPAAGFDLNALYGNSVVLPTPSTNPPTHALDPFSMAFPASTPHAVLEFSSPQPASANDLVGFGALLPDPRKPLVKTATLHVEYQKEGGADYRFFFSNSSAAVPLAGVLLSIAVPKKYQLQLQSPSDSSIAPGQTDRITQLMRVLGVQPGETLKVKWRVDYTAGSTPASEQGVTVL